MLGETGGRLALVGALLLASGVVAVAYVTQRERDVGFCTSCHGPVGGGARLHEGLHARTTGRDEPPPDLAAAHFRHGSRVECIDCHGGVGMVGRARVLALSARDTLLYVSRRYEEPRGMSFAPLRDHDCTQCHSRFEVVTVEEGEAGRIPFHGRIEHHGLPMRCVTCHEAHVPADPRLRFVRDEAAVPQCRRCHEELGSEYGEAPGAGQGAGRRTWPNDPRSSGAAYVAATVSSGAAPAGAPHQPSGVTSSAGS